MPDDTKATPMSDPSIKNLEFDQPVRDPSAIPITVNRIPAKPPLAPELTAPAIADDKNNWAPTPPPPVGSAGLGRPLFQPDSAKPMPPHPPVSPAGKSRGGKMWLWVVLVLLVAVVGVYLAADDGIIRGGSHLPYHIFSKYKTPATNNSTTTSSSVPSGFTNYQLSDAKLSFDVPTAWGTPTFASDPGYSSRGGGAQTDGTHAYIVAFPTNKDVELVMTTGQSLPASASDKRFFDYLGWCVGSIDQKYYLSQLLYTTSGGVDTPATVACDQGPLPNVTKINDSTILEGKATDTTGKVLGDIYIKNISGNASGVVVFRALDSTMTNGDNIQTLLGTVQNQ